MKSRGSGWVHPGESGDLQETVKGPVWKGPRGKGDQEPFPCRRVSLRAWKPRKKKEGREGEKMGANVSRIYNLPLLAFSQNTAAEI